MAERDDAVRPLCTSVERCRCPRHRSEQYFTSSQTAFHFLRHWKGRPQVAQVLVGRSAWWGISVRASLSAHTNTHDQPSYSRTSDTSAHFARADALSLESRTVCERASYVVRLSQRKSGVLGDLSRLNSPEFQDRQPHAHGDKY